MISEIGESQPWIFGIIDSISMEVQSTTPKFLIETTANFTTSIEIESTVTEIPRIFKYLLVDGNQDLSQNRTV